MPKDKKINMTNTPLPKQTDVVIIGGGIVGVSAAWHLAVAGYRVTLCEKGMIGGEQTGRNWGWCRKTLRDPKEIPLMQQSARDWQDKKVFGNLETGYRTTGIVYFSGRQHGDTEHYVNWLSSIRDFGLDSHMITASEVDQLIPGGTNLPRDGALFTPSDGCAEPSLAASVICTAAADAGAKIFQNTAVRGLERYAGQVREVVTEKGAIRCDAVVLAGGAWSRLFAGQEGINLPALNVMGSAMRTLPFPNGPNISVAGRRFGWRKRADGGYIVSQADATIFDIVPDSFRLVWAFRPQLLQGLRQLRLRFGAAFFHELKRARKWALDETTPFELERIANPAPAQAVLEEAAQRLKKAFPVFDQIQIAHRWGGLIDVTPDALPLIGTSASVPSLIFATGFSGHGFGLGPGGGRLAAELVIGGSTCVDPSPFAPARFGL